MREAPLEGTREATEWTAGDLRHRPPAQDACRRYMPRPGRSMPAMLLAPCRDSKLVYMQNLKCVEFTQIRQGHLIRSAAELRVHNLCLHYKKNPGDAIVTACPSYSCAFTNVSRKRFLSFTSRRTETRLQVVVGEKPNQKKYMRCDHLYNGRLRRFRWFREGEEISWGDMTDDEHDMVAPCTAAPRTCSQAVRSEAAWFSLACTPFPPHVCPAGTCGESAKCRATFCVHTAV